MGLLVSIYKNGGASYSNGGVSQFMDQGVLVNVEGPFEPDNVRTAALALVKGNVAGTAKVVPVEMQEDGTWVVAAPASGIGPMMGGCYVGTSDGRFTDAVEKIVGAKFYGAVPLHDRFETPAEYEMLSA